jgi:hypothetical protein
MVSASVLVLLGLLARLHYGCEMCWRRIRHGDVDGVYMETAGVDDANVEVIWRAWFPLNDLPLCLPPQIRDLCLAVNLRGYALKKHVNAVLG